jgi:hypothetical protein
MKTIEATAIVTPDGKIQIEDLKGIPEVGKFSVILIFGEQSPASDNQKDSQKSNFPFTFKPLNWGNIPPEMTFRREDMYDDERG